MAWATCYGYALVGPLSLAAKAPPERDDLGLSCFPRRGSLRLSGFLRLGSLRRLSSGLRSPRLLAGLPRERALCFQSRLRRLASDPQDDLELAVGRGGAPKLQMGASIYIGGRKERYRRRKKSRPSKII